MLFESHFNRGDTVKLKKTRYIGTILDIDYMTKNDGIIEKYFIDFPSLYSYPKWYDVSALEFIRVDYDEFVDVKFAKTFDVNILSLSINIALDNYKQAVNDKDEKRKSYYKNLLNSYSNERLKLKYDK